MYAFTDVILGDTVIRYYSIACHESGRGSGDIALHYL